MPRLSTSPIRYIVRVPNQTISPSYNVGLGIKNAQLYADLTAKLHRGAIFAQDANGQEELVGSYVRTYPQSTPAQSPEAS